MTWVSPSSAANGGPRNDPKATVLVAATERLRRLAAHVGAAQEALPDGELQSVVRVAGPAANHCAACVTDVDLDRVPDDVDNCPDMTNPDQADADRDGIGDVCDDNPA